MWSASSAARSCSLGALLVLGLLVLPGVTLGSDAPPRPLVAPTVTATVPSAGAIQVPVLAAIEVQFSESMNPATVLYDVQPPPPVALTPSWPSPDRFRLQPAAPGLDPCKAYSVTVDARDADENLPLVPGPSPNPWSFMTLCGNPFILSTSPPHGAQNVRTDATIVVTFSEPMDVFSVELLLMPSPPTQFTSWDGTRTVLTRTTILQSGVSYTATVQGADTGGNNLVPGLVPNPWTFRANRPPDLTGPTLSSAGCLLSGTDLDIGWTMSDDGEMERNLTVRLSFLNASREETILGPASGFPPSASFAWTLPLVDVTTRVRLRVNDSAGGVSTADSETFRIDTGPPRVTQTVPGNGSTNVPFGARVSISFSEPMNRSSVEAGLAADPPLAGAQYQWSPDGRALTIDPGGLRDRTTYRVTVGAGSRDTCGPGLTMGAPFTFSFATGKAPSPPPALLWATDVTEVSVSLAWEPVTVFVTGAPIPPDSSIVYRVFRGRNESDPGELILEVNGTRATDRRLQPSTLYVYRVRAVVDGVSSEPTAFLAVRTRPPFFTTPEGRVSVIVTLLALGLGLLAGSVQWRKRRTAEAAARLREEIREIVDQVRDAREETDPERRRRKEAALQAHFQGLVEGATEGEDRPDSRLEGLYRALAAALVRSPEVDIAQGRRAVDRRLGRLATAVRRYGATYRLLSEAEASVASDLFPDLPESGKKALLLVYFYGLEEYLGHRLRALIPAGATLLLGDRGHLSVRRRGWEEQWASLSLGTLVFLADRNRHFFVANEARWEDEVEPLLREAVQVRNVTAHPSRTPPDLAHVRRLVYGTLPALEAVLRRRPTSGVAA